MVEERDINLESFADDLLGGPEVEAAESFQSIIDAEPPTPPSNEEVVDTKEVKEGESGEIKPPSIDSLIEPKIEAEQDNRDEDEKDLEKAIKGKSSDVDMDGDVDSAGRKQWKKVKSQRNAAFRERDEFKQKYSTIESEYNSLKEQLEAIKAEKEEAYKIAKDLEVYRDRYDLENSPEFIEKYQSQQDHYKSKALTLAEIYGQNAEAISEVFNAKNLSDAKDKLLDNISDEHAANEIGNYITEYFLNKHEQAQALKSTNPKEIIGSIVEEKKQRELEREQERQIFLQNAKQIGKNEGDSALFDKIPEFVEKSGDTDYNNRIVAPTKELADTLYNQGFDYLAGVGATLNSDGAKWFRELTIHAAGYRAKEAKVAMLEKELSEYKKSTEKLVEHRSPGLNSPTTYSENGLSDRYTKDPKQGLSNFADDLLANKI